jgi:DNA polymerase sigma
MPTLYVENVPAELYEAILARARKNRSSIAAEVLELLQQNIPTAKELKRREQIFQRILRLQSQRPLSRGPFPSAEEMVREDRER